MVEEVGGDHIFAEVWRFVDGDTVDGFIRAVMHISGIIRELPFTHWLNRAQTINSHFGVKDIRRAVFSLLNGTCRPVTGINIICGGFITENIQRYRSKLTATTAMAE